MKTYLLFLLIISTFLSFGAVKHGNYLDSRIGIPADISSPAMLYYPSMKSKAPDYQILQQDANAHIVEAT